MQRKCTIKSRFQAYYEHVLHGTSLSTHYEISLAIHKPFTKYVLFANWLSSHYRLFLSVYLPSIEHLQCTCKFACKPLLLFFLFEVFLDIICPLQKMLSMQIRYQSIMSNVLCEGEINNNIELPCALNKAD